MPVSSLRRLLFDRLVLNLALLVGLAQLAVWHWWHVVVGGREGPGLAIGLALAVGLVAANAWAVPWLRRSRRRGGLVGAAARGYMALGVATLLLGLAVAVSWLGFLLAAGLLGAFGASPAVAFGGFRAASLGLVGFVALSLAWGFTLGQTRIARTRQRFALPGLDPSLGGLRIAHVSDLHIGNGLEGERLDRMVARVNALEADAIVVTGDIFDFDPRFVEDGASRLAGLRAPLGVYAILGNHDTYTGTETVVSALGRRAPALRLLRDEVVRLPTPAPLYLAGVEDPGRDWSARGIDLAGLSRVGAARPDDGPVVLLVHRPEAFPQAARLGFPLVLAGHTHGGQLALPTPRGSYNLARFVTRFTRGVYRIDGSTLFVNRGLGVAGPALRINCSREIAVVELVPG